MTSYDRALRAREWRHMPDLTPLRLLLITFAGWVNRHQARVVDYLIEENRVLKEQDAIAERWVLSVKSECLDKMILFGEKTLRRALREYGVHFHGERPHQGRDNELIQPAQIRTSAGAEIVETERLGGLLRSYQRAAA